MTVDGASAPEQNPAYRPAHSPSPDGASRRIRVARIIRITRIQDIWSAQDDLRSNLLRRPDVLISARGLPARRDRLRADDERPSPARAAAQC